MVSKKVNNEYQIVTNILEEQLLSVAANMLWAKLEAKPRFIKQLAREFGVSEEQLLEAAEELIINLS